MTDYKEQFVRFLLQTGALGVFAEPTNDRKLKSGRVSPWFVNLGEFNDGQSTGRLAGYYADAIITSEVRRDVLYGIPEKGVGLAAPVAMAMAERGHNVGWCFSRKDPKTHGEATGLGSNDRAKKLLVGKVPTEGQAVIQLDDVFTAGDAKYEARAFLQSLEITNLPLLAIAVDRMEVGIDASGRSAIEIYQEQTQTRVVSVVNAVEVYNILKEGNLASERALERLANYLRVYGTKDARSALPTLEQRIIKRDKSVIVACDVETLDQFKAVVQQTYDLEGIGGYKVGFALGLAYGLPAVVAAAREYTQKPLIYDHQKAGTDIPYTGRSFARVMKTAGIDAVILFPQAGPETQRAWMYEALDQGLGVIVGGRMTHPGYAVSEGGYITDEGALDMYKVAARVGVNHFVVPGNKPVVIGEVKAAIEAEGVPSPVFMAPGFIAQGGKIEDATTVAGERFHGIVGRAIYNATDMNTVAKEYTKNL